MRRPVHAAMLLLAMLAAAGCSAVRPKPQSCACASTGCACLEAHANGELACDCRPRDAYGGRTNVGDPDGD